MVARVGVAVVLIGALAGCTSHTAASRTPHTRDARLFGTWHAISARSAGGRSIQTDDTSVSSLRFDRRGQFTVNGERCEPVLRFHTVHHRVHVDYAYKVECGESTSLNDVAAARVKRALERLTDNGTFSYSIGRRRQLVVSAGGETVVLQRADDRRPADPPITPSALPPTSPPR